MKDTILAILIFIFILILAGTSVAHNLHLYYGI